MVRKLLLSICLSVVTIFSFSQEFQVNGIVKDLKTHEPIAGAVAYELYTSENGTSTDTEGFFSLSFKKSKALMKIALIGYKDTILNLSLEHDTTLIIFIESQTDIEEVEIEDDEIIWKPGQDSLSGELRIIDAELIAPVVHIKKEEIVNPLIRNVDPGSLSDLYYINGKGSNQELIFINGSKIFNSYNIFDFIPYVQDKALQSFNRFETSFPAPYGDALNSVTDIRLKEGNFRSYQAEVYLDLFNFSIAAHGPVIKDKSSLFISSRLFGLNNPYTRLFMSDMTLSNEYWAKPVFFDINMNYTHKLSETDKLNITFFKNSNVFKTETNSETLDVSINKVNNYVAYTYSNTLASLGWNHTFSPKFASNISLNFSQYNLKNEIFGDSSGLLNNSLLNFNEYDAKYKSGNNDLTLKMNFNYLFNPDHFLKFGAYITNHHFNAVSGVLEINDYENNFFVDTSWKENPVNAGEYVLFVDDRINIDDKLFINGGLHFSAYTIKGTNFFSVQPRVFAEYKVFKGLSIRAAYANYKQYIHFLSNNSIGLSSDIFISSDEYIKPQTTNHFSGGITLNLPFEINIIADVFYDQISNVLEYKFGYSYFDFPETSNLTGTNLTERLMQGNADLYGLRVLFNKNINNLQFNIGHTISNYDRSFNDLTVDESFQYKYNKRHDFDFGLRYLLSDNFKIKIDFVYRSGNYITVDKQSYIPYDINETVLGTSNDENNTVDWNGEPIISTSSINDYQLPAYHRLDISAYYSLDKHTFGLKIYNLYNERNIDFVDYKMSVLSNSSTNQLIKYTMLPFLPTITYSYRFN